MQITKILLSFLFLVKSFSGSSQVLLSFQNTETEKIEETELDIKNILMQENNIDLLKALCDKYETIRNFVPNISPMRNARITSFFGMRFHPIYAENRFHGGLDMVGDDGVVYSTITGIVTNVGYDSENGNFVVIENHYGFKTIYCHLSEVYINIGEVITKGTEVAKFGSTGTATSVHLHYVIKKNDKVINPLPFVRGW